MKIDYNIETIKNDFWFFPKTLKLILAKSIESWPIRDPFR